MGDWGMPWCHGVLAVEGERPRPAYRHVDCTWGVEIDAFFVEVSGMERIHTCNDI